MCETWDAVQKNFTCCVWNVFLSVVVLCVFSIFLSSIYYENMRTLKSEKNTVRLSMTQERIEDDGKIKEFLYRQKMCV